MERKKSIRIEDLCEGLPEEFAEYMRNVRQLEHGDLPDYARLRELFRRRAEREGWDDDEVFDWTVLLFLQHKHASKRVVQPRT